MACGRLVHRDSERLAGSAFSISEQVCIVNAAEPSELRGFYWFYSYRFLDKAGTFLRLVIAVTRFDLY